MTPELASSWYWRLSAAGLAVWAPLAVVFGGQGGFYRTIEAMVCLAVLVIVPLGLALPSGTFRGGRTLAWAIGLHPLAAAAAVASFALPPGRAAGLLAAPWLALCAFAALRALPALRDALVGLYRQPPAGPPSGLARLCFAAAPLYLPVGAMFLVQSRLGATPMGFTEPIVLLTAVHFHFTGFSVPLFAGMTGGLAGEARGWARALFRLSAPGAIAASPLLAAGWVFDLAALKLAAAVWLAASLWCLAALLLARLRRVAPLPAQALLLVAALSIAAGMALAGLYAAGEFAGRDWITIPRMTSTHGILNSLGFSLCGLAGWALARPSRPAP